MVMCSAPGCNHSNDRETCKFFTLPTDTKLRDKWLLRRDVVPGPDTHMCSCHFPGGKEENNPVIFSINILKRDGITAEPGPSTSSTSIVRSKTEHHYLKQPLEQLKSESRHGAFSFKEIERNEDLFRLYTGLPRCRTFIALYELFENIPINYYSNSIVAGFEKIDQLLMCLMKLRQAFPDEDLAFRFKVSLATVSNVVITWIHVLHELLYERLNSKIPSQKKNQTCLPNEFSTFTNFRIALDCREIARTDPTTSMNPENRWKAVVGVAPNGVITYVSSLYPNAISDEKIVQHCGVLEQLEAGDLILADDGLFIRDLLPDGVSLNTPPYLQNAPLTASQEKQIETIDRALIHVERAIQRMSRFKILNYIPPLLFEHAREMVQVIGSLTNLQDPLIDEPDSD